MDKNTIKKRLRQIKRNTKIGTKDLGDEKCWTRKDYSEAILRNSKGLYLSVIEDGLLDADDNITDIDAIIKKSDFADVLKYIPTDDVFLHFKREVNEALLKE